jgi:hypothetical protein
VYVRAHVGWNVSGVMAPLVQGSSPLSFVGMHVLSLNECHIVLSHVPCCPSSQLVADAQGTPTLQTPACMHVHAKTGSRPVGWLPEQPIADGMALPFGWVSAAAGTETALARLTRARARVTRIGHPLRASIS